MVAKYLLVLCIGIVCGIALGIVLAAAAQASSDQAAIDSGIVKIGKRFYKISPLVSDDSEGQK